MLFALEHIAISTEILIRIMGHCALSTVYGYVFALLSNIYE